MGYLRAWAGALRFGRVLLGSGIDVCDRQWATILLAVPLKIYTCRGDERIR